MKKFRGGTIALQEEPEEIEESEEESKYDP